jgi:hypothetical protein
LDGWISFLPGLTAFVGFAVASPFVLRIRPEVAPVVLHFAVAVATHALGTLAGAVLVEDFAYWHGAAGFALPVMAYVFVFGAVQKSVSLRMLSDLHRTPDGRLTLDELTERVARRDFDARIDLLLEKGYVTRHGTGFAPTERGKSLVAKLAKLQKLARIERTGMYGD